MGHGKIVLLASIFIFGCGESASQDGPEPQNGSSSQAQPNADAGNNATQPDTGVQQCACIEVNLSSHGNLCDAPEIQFGCQTEPQIFPRIADVAPPCWSTTIDPVTGCAMPQIRGLGTSECSCWPPPSNDDAGVGGRG